MNTDRITAEHVKRAMRDADLWIEWCDDTGLSAGEILQEMENGCLDLMDIGGEPITPAQRDLFRELTIERMKREV